MATFTKDFIEINLSTDELMLKELERRDGIYSFIFHELEGPKSETPTISISPGKLIDRTYTEAIERTRTAITTKTTKTTNELNDTDSNSGSEDSNNNLQIKVKNALNQRAHVRCHSNSTSTTTTTAVATKTNSITHSPPSTPTSLNRTLPTDTGTGTAAGTTMNATPAIIIPSIFTTTTTTTTLSDGVLPPSLSSLSSLNMRNYHEHFKTWHPPPSFVYDNPKLYAYIANCGFRVRLPTPRFSHISAPLVRNRRHALKETLQYKRMSEFCMCAPVADLRTLFPHDPDVHAPFASSLSGVTVTLKELSDVTVAHEGKEEQVAELQEADSCCGGMTMVDAVSALK